MTARQAVQEFGEDNVGTKIKEAVKAKPDTQFNFIHAVEPTSDYERSVGMKSKTKLPFHSCHVCFEDKMVVRVGGYNEFPYLVPRWSKATGEIFGRSPSYNALPDIKTLNKAVEIGLKAWAKAIDPPLLVTDDGVIGRVRMTPAGITVVRYELMQRLLGPTLGRFQTEFLNPLIERVFGIMMRSNALMPRPEAMSGMNMDIEYVGPLARSQRMEEAIAVERLYQLAMQVVQVDPTVMDVINHEQAIRMRATLLGVPKTVLRGEDEVAEIREERAAAQQAAQEQAMAQQQADTALSQGKAMTEMSKPETKEGMEEAMAQAEQQGLV
jgi:hypothetical protein